MDRIAFLRIARNKNTLDHTLRTLDGENSPDKAINGVGFIEGEDVVVLPRDTWEEMLYELYCANRDNQPDVQARTCYRVPGDKAAFSNNGSIPKRNGSVPSAPAKEQEWSSVCLLRFCFVNGHKFVVPYTDSTTLEDLRRVALSFHGTDRSANEWEIRDESGNRLDPTTLLSILKPDTKIYINLPAGHGD